MNHISSLRLISQQIAETQFKTAKEIVDWMGAVQAQDFPMAKWALGARLPGSTDQSVETAFNNGEILRTHVLRPTWHFVKAEDISWMLSLSAPQIKAATNARHKQLGFNADIFAKCNKIIVKNLANSNFMTRKELMAELEKAGIATDEYRSGHLMLQAELEGLVCSGPRKGKELTYALLDERVAKKINLTKEEALGTLAKRYFTSHSPATFHDFLWWSGLYTADARTALELVKPMFVSEKIGEQTYYFNPSFSVPGNSEASVFLLPAFDEFLISYKDRSASLTFKHNNKAVSNNGIFRPIVVVNGTVTGIWKRTFNKEKVVMEASFFEKQWKEQMQMIEKAAVNFGKFVEKEAVFSSGLV